jgi:hypothetical protein
MNKVSFSFFLFLTSLILATDSSAHVILDFPLGGETFTGSEKINIQWHVQIPHDQENWDLYFSDDGGASWQAIELDMETSQLHYQWTVPQITTEQARIRVIMDNTGQDYIDTSGDFKIQEANGLREAQTENPKTFALFANYPNPFNPLTFISYQLPVVSAVKLIVYDQLGNPVKILVDKTQPAGIHRVQWDGRNNLGNSIASGVYLYRLEAGAFTQVRRMVLLR